MKTTFGSMLFVLAVMLAHTANGALVFNDRGQWEAAQAGPVFNENFNTGFIGITPVIIDGDVIDLPNGLTILGNGAGGLAFLDSGSPDHFDTWHIETDFEAPVTQLVFQFDQPTYAIGFDYAAANFVGSIWLTGIDGLPFSPTPNSNDSEILFFGVIADTPFTSIAFATNALDQDYAIDNFAFGSQVPLPGAAWLLMSAIAFLVTPKLKD